MLIEPLTIKQMNKIFNAKSIEIIKYFIIKSIFSQPELRPNQKPLPIHIPKEHLEQWLVQALDVEPIGAGSYAIDVINHRESWGADAKMLAWSGKEKSLSGETSLAQKFKGAGVDLDQAFQNKNYDLIINNWSELLIEKYKKIFSDYQNLKDIYFFFFIREKLKFHLCGMRLNINNINLCYKKSSSDSVWVENCIDDELGDVKIYKAKKRMELRLKPFNWIKKNYFKSFDFEKFILPETNFNEIQDEKNRHFNVEKIFEFSSKRFLDLLKNF